MYTTHFVPQVLSTHWLTYPVRRDVGDRTISGGSSTPSNIRRPQGTVWHCSRIIKIFITIPIHVLHEITKPLFIQSKCNNNCIVYQIGIQVLREQCLHDYMWICCTSIVQMTVSESSQLLTLKADANGCHCNVVTSNNDHETINKMVFRCLRTLVVKWLHFCCTWYLCIISLSIFDMTSALVYCYYYWIKLLILKNWTHQSVWTIIIIFCEVTWVYDNCIWYIGFIVFLVLSSYICSVFLCLMWSRCVLLVVYTVQLLCGPALV